MGWPIRHSLSPRLHGYWLEHHGVDGAYLPLAVAPDDLAAALSALPVLGFRGVNLTVPHKERALGLCHEVDDLARRIGAVNTVVVRERELFGSNSDAFGFLENLRQGAPDWRAEAAPAVVVGAGGAARAVVVALIDAGAPEVRIVNRTRERAAALAAALGGSLSVRDWDERDAALRDAGLLVNATTLGMEGQPPLELDLGALPPDALVTDLVYSPLVTPLLAAAAARGNPLVDGLGMLL
ncbi:MAG: shikimate dehydrogenase, partial [Kiloniellales bacterium]|nr:shikimate dehydrogenase [Kiloniellales bacterium]